MPAARERTNPKNGAPDNRRGELVRAAAQLTKPRTASRVSLDALADETVALVLRDAHRNRE